jgi:hypothetical protein
MEDPDEQLIRRALGRRAPPKPGRTLADDVLRRVATGQQTADGRRAASQRWLTASWLATAAVSIEVLARLPWSDGARTLAWGLALVLVPLTYAAALWPDRALGMLVLCGRPLLGGPLNEPAAVSWARESAEKATAGAGPRAGRRRS